jgi:hypothetical protein
MEVDPLVNLDFICVAMILKQKKTLLESDFSMCLGTLLHYPEDVETKHILVLANKVKKRMNLEEKDDQEEPSPASAKAQLTNKSEESKALASGA